MGTDTLTLLVVVAHPDDDPYGIEGSVALHAQGRDHGGRAPGRVRHVRTRRLTGEPRLLHFALAQVFDRWQQQRAELGLLVFDPS